MKIVYKGKSQHVNITLQTKTLLQIKEKYPEINLSGTFEDFLKEMLEE